MDKPAKKRVHQFKANRQVIVFVGCFLLALVIWFVNALSKQYTTTVDQQIIYKRLPANVLPAELPQKLISEVSGRGFDLMQYSLRNNNHSLIIDFDKLPASVFAGNPSAVNTSQLLKIYGSDSKNPVSITHVTPEIIQFNSSEIYSKKIRVKANIKYSFKKQYAQSGALIIQPDSIYISGDSTVIDAINEVETVPADFNILDKTLFHSLILKQSVNDKINYSTDKVWVYMKVEPFTEGSVSIPVNIENIGMKQITLIPDFVTVNYHVPLSLFSNIRPEQFEATTTISNSTETNKLKVRLIRMPVGVTNIKIAPQEVDFFIKQN